MSIYVIPLLNTRFAYSSSTCSENTPARSGVCELIPLFELSQPTVLHRLKVLRAAGIVDSERQGLWAYYFVIAHALKGPLLG